jgi:hypothetical protein
MTDRQRIRPVRHLIQPEPGATPGINWTVVPERSEGAQADDHRIAPVEGDLGIAAYPCPRICATCGMPKPLRHNPVGSACAEPRSPESLDPELRWRCGKNELDLLPRRPPRARADDPVPDPPVTGPVQAVVIAIVARHHRSGRCLHSPAAARTHGPVVRWSSYRARRSGAAGVSRSYRRRLSAHRLGPRLSTHRRCGVRTSVATSRIADAASRPEACC